MSNISQASKELKKKLSFKDYDAPAEQQEAKPVSQPIVEQMPASQPTILDSKPVSQTASASKPLKQYTGKEEALEGAKKIKVTFYLSEEDNQLLMDIFIKRLQQRNKTDKSALISEALHLFYKREMK